MTDAYLIGYRTVVLAPPSDPVAYLPVLAREADRAGLLNGDRVWVVPDASGTFSEYLTMIVTQAERGGALDRLLGGMAVIRTADGFEVPPSSSPSGTGTEADDDAAGSGTFFNEEDKFLRAWDSAFGPPDRDADDDPPTALASSPPSPPPLPPPRSSFVYDSIVALGMGLCRRRRRQSEQRALAAVGIDDAEIALSESMRSLSFRGASGYVTFDPRTGERSVVGGGDDGDAEGLAFGMYNVRRVADANGEEDADDLVGYRLVLTSTCIIQPAGDDPTSKKTWIWSEIPDESFLYASGLDVPPHLLRDDQSPSYLSLPVHRAGLALMSISLLISATSALWVFFQRKTRIVKASQPQFLYVLCSGSAVSASSVAFMSYDESYGVSTDRLSAYCVVSAWLFVTGYVAVYAALHMKLLRIHRVLQFRRLRGRVRNRQVAWPMASLMTGALIVLSVWTALDPYSWTRDVVTVMPPLTCGTCASDNLMAYLIPLGVIMIAATALTAGVAWKARDIPSEYQESGWIWYGVFAHLQSWIIGLPVLVILAPAHSSPDATYLGRVLLICTFSTTMVALVIWPKIFVATRKRIYGDDDGTAGSNNSSSGGPRGGLKFGTGRVVVSGMGSGNSSGASGNNSDNVNAQSYQGRSNEGSSSSDGRSTDRRVVPPADNRPPPASGDDCSSPAQSTATSKTACSSSSAESDTSSNNRARSRSVKFQMQSGQEGGPSKDENDDSDASARRRIAAPAAAALASLEAANERMREELDTSEEKLARKVGELEDATVRIAALEETLRERDGALRSMRERVSLFESRVGVGVVVVPRSDDDNDGDGDGDGDGEGDERRIRCLVEGSV